MKRFLWIIPCLVLLTSGIFVHRASYVPRLFFHSSFAYPIPGSVEWQGTSYTTKGSITTVGQKLGGVSTPAGQFNVFAVPGKPSTQEIALEVDTLSMKYVEADAGSTH